MRTFSNVFARLAAFELIRKFRDQTFDESKHPRADDGKFGTKGGTETAERPAGEVPTETSRIPQMTVGAVLQSKQGVAERMRSRLGELGDLAGKVKEMNLGQLAGLAAKDWGGKVNFAARPYLSAMRGMNAVSDNFGADSGHSVVAYFLSNASQWRGPTAKIVKDELKRRLKSKG